MILKSNLYRTLKIFLYKLVTKDVTLLVKDLGDRFFHLRARDLNYLMIRLHGVADSC